MNKILKKFLSFSYGSWVGLIIGFLLTPILTRTLTPEQFGTASMFPLALNFLLIISLMGTDQSFVRFFYEEIDERRKFLLKKSVISTLVISIFLSSIILIFEEKFSVFVFGAYYPVLMKVLVVSLFFNILTTFSNLSIRMQQKGNLYSLLQIINKLVNFALTIVLIFLIGAEFEIIIYALFITLIVMSTISISLDKNNWTEFFISKPTSFAYKDLYKYGYPLMFATLVGFLFQVFDRIALQQLSNPTELGIYVAAFKIIALLSVIQTSFTLFWVPTALESYENDKENKDFIQNMFILVSFFMFILAILVIAFKDVIGLILGDDFKNSAMLMPFLIFIPVMRTLSEVTVMGIVFKKKVKLNLIIDISTLLLNLIGNLALIPLIGAKGAAISTGLSYIFFFVLRTTISLKFYPVRFALKRAYFLIFLIVLYAALSTFIAWSIVNSIIGIFLILVIFLCYINDIINIFKVRKN